jgi:hypothetical protein
VRRTIVAGLVEGAAFVGGGRVRAAALGDVFFKVGGGDEDGTAEFADVDSAEGRVLLDVEP